MKNIILINKPLGWTSHDVCLKIKNKFKFKKVGHSGTLDPMATGLLVIGYNDGTKLLGTLSLDNKEYRAEFIFGTQTTTGDKTGKIIKTCKSNVNKKQLKQTINFFRKNTYWQKPHIFSAKKINGKKAYELARQNISFSLKPVKVNINKIKILNFNCKEQSLNLLLNVSKGFYVRSFCEDLATKLQTFGYVNKLQRIKCGKLKLKKAMQLEDFLKQNI